MECLGGGTKPVTYVTFDPDLALLWTQGDVAEVSEATCTYISACMHYKAYMCNCMCVAACDQCFIWRGGGAPP